LFSQLLT
jgi:murein tripeptide amidase MpaA